MTILTTGLDGLHARADRLNIQLLHVEILRRLRRQEAGRMAPIVLCGKTLNVSERTHTTE